MKVTEFNAKEHEHARKHEAQLCCRWWSASVMELNLSFISYLHTSCTCLIKIWTPKVLNCSFVLLLWMLYWIYFWTTAMIEISCTVYPESIILDNSALLNAEDVNIWELLLDPVVKLSTIEPSVYPWHRPVFLNEWIEAIFWSILNTNEYITRIMNTCIQKR